MGALKGTACYLFAVWIEHILSCESVTRFVTVTSSPTISVFATASSAMAISLNSGSGSKMLVSLSGVVLAVVLL